MRRLLLRWGIVGTGKAGEDTDGSVCEDEDETWGYGDVVQSQSINGI